MSVVVFTSDKYLPLLTGFAVQFNKYWNPATRVGILGFKEPDFKLPPNFKFISAGAQDDFAPREFCGAFRPIIEALPTEHITYFLEDTFPIAPLHQEAYDEAVSLICSEQAHKIQLFWGDSQQYAKSVPFNDRFRAFAQTAHYRCNIAPSIVHKEYFLKYFEPSMTLSEYEVNNQEKAKNDGANILISWRQPISPWFNVIRHGHFNHHMGNRIEQSSENRFGWNPFQMIPPEDMENIMQYKEWIAK